MTNWRDRMEAARIEFEEARIEWNEAESAMARASARKSRAERQFHRVFQEKMDELERSDSRDPVSTPQGRGK